MAHEVGRPSVPLFALIIGIGDYAMYPQLRGAVTDAKAIKHYLEVDLQVSEDHIFTLFDKEATRTAIIEAFQKILDDERINKGDPIVIFYAGHGGECPPPLAWNLKGKVQCLIPQDCEITGAEPLPIPDRTIGALIEDIAKAKGDNITVIFDCCHSASGTRGQDDEYVPRSVDLHFNIPETLDDYVWGSRDVSIASNFAYHGLRSHVLLAACREKESAYEHKGRGLFTSALLATLRSCATKGLTLTYAELLKRILLESEHKFKKLQHPQCEGFNQNRALFDARVSSGGQIFYPVQIQKGGIYAISAGLAHGVSPGMEFALYDSRKHILDIVPVDARFSINNFTTTITPPLPLTNVSFAKLNPVWEIPLYTDPRGPLSSTLKTLLRGTASTQRFRLVEAEDAKLEVAMENNRVVFKVLDERLRRFGLTELPYKATIESVARIFGAAARYCWFLDLAKEHDETSDNPEVAVDFYRLGKAYDDDGNPILSPDGREFWHRDRISRDGSDAVDLTADPDIYYGFKITNKTPWDLYLNAFMFNGSCFSINAYYTQSSVGEPEAPLKRGETFTIGYGNGTPPLSFELEEGQDVDVSFLKIFFATRPVDMSDVTQQSPFDSINARDGEDDSARGGSVWSVVKAMTRMSLLARKPEHTWFTLVIPVVQRRSVAA
ncbi:caspase domain-containing protein [Boletus edulis BED1]|uniref:Caspase domain-containing protein n=1 Tax=Boletus edulis BED1 TaxID=1328754 RepID=A0AAD4BP99_BOLED|nr:caspase domain-containing protein [Boletus edulis BED1]